MIQAVLFLELLIFATGCTRSKPLPEEQKEVTASNLVDRVVGILQNSGRSGSLAYEGTCTPRGDITDSLRVGTPQAGIPVVEALHQALASEPSLTVKEDASGSIRIVGANVNTELLGLRIPEIRFRSEDNPRDATATLLIRPEVKSYMQSHRINFENVVNQMAPMPKGAHLNTILRNATISEALDRIAQTFPGVWIYRECATRTGERLVDITFVEF